MGGRLKVAIDNVIREGNYALLDSKKATDPLFNSFSWHAAWWLRWGKNFNIVIVNIKSRDKINCLFPLYIDEFRLKGVLSVKRLQFIGTNYQNVSSPRAEYLAFAIDSDFEKAVDLGFDCLEKVSWDEFVARDIVKGDFTDLAITQWAKARGWLTRIIHTDTAYSINTDISFEEYKKQLSASARLKLINRRKHLDILGKINIENYYPDRILEFFDLLNDFHAKRWGDTFSKETISFHQEIISNAAPGGLQVELSVLKVNDVCESVMFNYVLDGRVYNINSGFNEDFHKKIAIGMLHFGYLIEASFEDPNIKVFDFLAGHGKNSNYKAKLATDSIELYSLQIVRNKLLHFLYSANDWVKKWLNKH